MKKTIFLQKTKLLLLLCLCSFILTTAQTNYTVSSINEMQISGTSTLHDWTMKSAAATTTATFTINAAGQLTNVTAVNFEMAVADLKSGKSSMDKNAYKALNKEVNPKMYFSLMPGTAVLTASTNGNYTLKCKGRLTIAGTTHETELEATCKLNADKSITVVGSKKINMKDYNVSPPSFMMGTIKTGSDIKLSFNLTLK